MAEVEEMAKEFEELAIVPSVSHGLRQTLSSSEATPLRAPAQLTVPVQLTETEFLVDAFYVGFTLELIEQEFLRDEVLKHWRYGWLE